MLEHEKETIKKFLLKCNDYGKEKIKQHMLEEEKTTSSKEQLEIQEKKTRWQTYIHFNEHALREIDKGELDSWF